MQRVLNRVHCKVLLSVFVVLLYGCDAEPGPSDPTGRPPLVSNLAFTPLEVDIQALDPSQIDGNIVEIQVDVTVQATDEDGLIDRVIFAVRPPAQDLPPVEFGFLTGSGSGQFEGSYMLPFDTGLTGNYTVEVYAIDDDNLLSNRVLGTLTIRNDGMPPVIDEIDAPDVIERPDTGTSLVALVAVVSDPDGLSNIANVLFWNVERPDDTFALFDDGEQGGDEVAGDGRYTVTIQISSTATLGTNVFAFQATDRGGLRSEVITKEITVE